MTALRGRRQSIALEDGSRVGVIGGGPAGSLFALFLLRFARQLDLGLTVDIYEPRDFTAVGPAGCNMCGGVVSESLVQALALEGVGLLPSLVRRGLDSYVLHTTDQTLSLETPLQESRIAAVHRGGGPRDAGTRTGGLDGYLLTAAREAGARVVRARVADAGRGEDGRPEVRADGERHSYELLVGAIGVNSAAWTLFEKLGLPSRPPRTARTYVTELRLGPQEVSRRLGSAMHLFLLDIPGLHCAAIIPKDEYATVCLLGDGIDRRTVEAFFAHASVRACLPSDGMAAPGRCHCLPHINEREAPVAFVDRVVLVGDCGVSRLYKDGIGAAYRTAKAAARTAAFAGVAESDFRRHFAPLYRRIARDNRYGALLFGAMHLMKAAPPLLRGALAMAAREQAGKTTARPMSLVFWDMFTGSAPYREILFRTLHPRFVVGFALASARAALTSRSGGSEGTVRPATAVPRRARGTADDREEAGMNEGVLGREYEDGEVLCRQGEPGDRMFVMQEGRAEVVCSEGGREVVVGELVPGDLFGEMAVVDRQPRSATVRAKGWIRALTLDKRAFLRRVHEDPTLAYRMLEGMSRKVRQLDEELALLRNASSVDVVRYVYVVSRDRPELVAQLRREFADDPEVEVVLDRREGDRRREGGSRSPDRRHGCRRSAEDAWSVHPSEPFRRGRGRLVAHRSRVGGG